VETLCEDGAPRVDAHDGEFLRAGVLLDDLVSDSHQGATQIIAVEDDLAFGVHARPFLASRDRVKGTDAASLAAASPGTSTVSPQTVANIRRGSPVYDDGSVTEADVIRAWRERFASLHGEGSKG
jgi:hypothetical protein